MTDESYLRSLSSRVDEASGIKERFVQPKIGGRTTVGVVSEPLGTRIPTGLVISPPFGLEQVYLARFDIQLARTLSAAGFPVLRYHGQGYGDSEGHDEVGLASHLADAKDAVAVLKDEADVEHVGVVGARLGGTVGALVADTLGLPLVVLVAPVTEGRRYIRQFLWSHVFADWTARMRRDPASATSSSADGSEDAAETETVQSIYAELDAQGWADIRGFRLTQSARHELESVSLVRDLQAFSGAALVWSLSRSGEPPRDIRKLADRLTQLGADVTLRGLADPMPEAFGRYNLQRVRGTKVDRLTEITRRISSETAAWCVQARSAEQLSP